MPTMAIFVLEADAAAAAARARSLGPSCGAAPPDSSPLRNRESELTVGYLNKSIIFKSAPKLSLSLLCTRTNFSE